MDHKSSREKAWIASKNKKNNIIINDGSNSEISNLQDGSFVEIDENERIPLTEEEKLEIRKKIGFLLIFVFAAFILMIIILIFDPFTSKKREKKKNDSDVPVVHESSLYDYEDGKIDISDKYIKDIYKEIKFNLIDFYEFDTYFLYKNNYTSTNSLSDLEKTILVSKSNDFNSIISNISTSSNICEEDIVVDSNEVSKIALNKYSTDVNLVPQFKYNYYYEESYIASINFTLKDNKYIGKCYKHGDKFIKIIEQKPIEASKQADNLFIDVRVAFISEKGVFKDPNYKELIANDKKAKSNDYMNKSRIYRYSYIVTDDGYYLNNVSLLK